MNENEIISFGKQVLNYCRKYHLPHEFFIDILEDQKVIPMIRGKGMEYHVYLKLKEILPSASWSIQKLNLNAQPGFYDEDISITHRKTGIILKVESKSAVRGSIRDGNKSKILKEPHFKVKCHRSRSNISLAETSNDRYSENDFDIIITNPVNSLFIGNTIGDSFEIVKIGSIKKILFDFYAVANEDDLINKVSNDWRFVIPKDIAENGFIPRTPYVKLKEDENWHDINVLEKRLISIINNKRNKFTRHI